MKNGWYSSDILYELRAYLNILTIDYSSDLSTCTTSYSS